MILLWGKEPDSYDGYTWDSGCFYVEGYGVIYFQDEKGTPQRSVTLRNAYSDYGKFTL